MFPVNNNSSSFNHSSVRAEACSEGCRAGGDEESNDQPENSGYVFDDLGARNCVDVLIDCVLRGHADYIPDTTDKPSRKILGWVGS